MTHLAIASGFVVVAGAASALTYWPEPPRDAFYGFCGKLWSHRTLGSGAPENSTEGLRQVLALGAGGAEIDLYYERSSGILYVQSEEFRDQGVPLSLTLPDLLATVPANGHLWLDFWNLRKLGPEDADRAIARLGEDIKAKRLRDNIIVESKSPAYLSKLKAAGFHTSLWIEIAPIRGSLTGSPRHRASALAALRQYKLVGASAISMDHSQYSGVVSTIFHGIPINLFTINDKTDVARAVKDESVAIVLSDRPFYKENACQP